MLSHRKPPKDHLGIAILISLLLHIPLWTELADWLETTPEVSQQEKKPLIARMVPKTNKKKKAVKPIPPPQEKGVVVRVPDPEKDVPPPPKANALARKNQKVKKEVKSRRRMTSTKPPRRGNKNVKKESNVQSAQSDRVDPTKMKKEKRKESAKRAPKNIPSSDVGRISKGQASKLPPHPSLLLPATNQEFAIANIQAQSARLYADDALRHVKEEGKETLLNTREFRYWQFFDRVKQRVRQNWNPGAEYRRRDPTGRLYGVSDRYTVLRITLNPAGNIERIGIVKKAGADFLDEEAWRAFRAAGPFPNPPEGLIGEDGRITFEFGFLFEISSGPKFFWKR